MGGTADDQRTDRPVLNRKEPVRLTDDLNVDLSRDGTVYGIEFLDAHNQLKAADGGRLVLVDASGAERTLPLATPLAHKDRDMMAQKKPTAEQSFLIQSHALMESIVKLSELESKKGRQFFVDQEIYGETALAINNDASKANVKHPIFGGQESLLSCLYLFLVLPQEWNANSSNPINIDLTQAEAAAKKYVQSEDESYRKDKSVLKHLRNALAHGRISWQDGKFSFTDEYKANRYSGRISMECLGKIAEELNCAIRNYIISCASNSG